MHLAEEVVYSVWVSAYKPEHSQFKYRMSSQQTEKSNIKIHHKIAFLSAMT